MGLTWLLVGLVFALLGAEGALSMLPCRRQKYLVLRPFERRRLELNDDLLPGLDPIARFRTNSRGIRAREFSRRDTYRVLAVGCSVSIGSFVDQATVWTRRVEEVLRSSTGQRVWMGNVGRSEATSRDVITMLEYFVPQISDDLDALIVWVGVNDLALALSKQDDYDPLFLHRLPEQQRLARAFVQYPGDSRRAICRLNGWRLARGVKSSVFTRHVRNAGAFYEEKRTKRKEAEVIIDDVPDLEPALADYTQNLAQAVDLARKAALRPLLMTLPAVWGTVRPEEQENRLWFGWIGESGTYYSHRVLARALDLYNRSVCLVSEQLGVDCIDLAATLPTDETAFYDDVHLNAHGHQLVAREVSSHLLSML